MENDQCSEEEIREAFSFVSDILGALEENRYISWQ
jgi:hypothetical protein